MRHLSAQQRKILKDLFGGASTKQIARDLNISAARVKAEIREIVRKVNVQSGAGDDLSH
jgi:DNA-binding NarL/FixJ family response regulator